MYYLVLFSFVLRLQLLLPLNFSTSSQELGLFQIRKECLILAAEFQDPVNDLVSPPNSLATRIPAPITRS